MAKDEVCRNLKEKVAWLCSREQEKSFRKLQLISADLPEEQFHLFQFSAGETDGVLIVKTGRAVIT